MKKILIYLLIAILPVFVNSCGPDDPDPEVTTNIVEVLNDISDVTTWYSDSIYVIKVYDFYVSNTLNIQAGTVIKFTDDGPYMMLGSGGTVNAIGTSDNPIIFTSYKDDAHGGDTNGDETGTSPARKDWGRISTNDNNGSIFTYCEFYYGGDGSYTSTLEVYGNNVQVKNCTLAHNAGDDGTGWYGALDANYAGSGCTITGNIFFDNVRPFSVNLLVDIDDSNVFFNPDDQSVGNTYNGIFVETGDDLDAALSWMETEVPFVIDDNDWWINSGASLTLGNNVILKFRPGSAMVLDDTDAIINHDGTGVYFTSYKDDVHGGDTNADDDSTLPGTGDWIGIYDNNEDAYLAWSNILYSE